RRQSPAAQPETEERSKHHQQRQETFLRQAEAIEGLVEGLRGHGRLNQKNVAANDDALAGDAILQGFQIRGEKRNALRGRIGERRLQRLKSLRTKNPLAVRAGDFKNGAIRPQAGEFTQLLLYFRNSPWQ